MIWNIASKELKSLFYSPLAWSILAVIMLILGYLFLGQLDLFLQVQARLISMDGNPGLTETVVTPIFSNAAIILLLVMPLLTMRLISEELRSDTISLLFSAPVSMIEIILGKFTGILGFILCILILTSLMPLSLLMGGTLDWGLLLSSYLGLFLLLASFAAAGLYVSTLTEQPTIAAVSTFGLLILLWVVDLTISLSGNTESALTQISMLKHYQVFLGGMIDTRDVIYYLLFITTFLVLSVRRLDSYRLQH